MSGDYSKFLRVICLVMLLLFAISGEAISGEEKDSSVEKAQDKKIKRAAEDYLDLVKRLTSLSHDYRKILMGVVTIEDSAGIIKIRHELEKFKTEKYLFDIKKLSEDMENLSQLLSENEELFERAAKSRAQAAARCIQEEVRILQDIYVVDIDEKLDRHSIQLDALQLYLSALDLTEDTEMLPPIEFIVVPDFPDTDFVLFAPPAPVRPAVPTPRRPSHTSVPPGSYDNVRYSKRGGVKLTRSFSQSLENINPSATIHISSLTGDIDLRGWDRDQIDVQLEVTLASDDHELINSLAGAVDLKLQRDNGNIFVEPVLPEMSDASAEIAEATLIVRIPRNNATLCKISFGELFAKDLGKAVGIEAHKADVLVLNASGGVDFIGTASQVEISRATGAVTVENDRGPVTLRECSGVISIENRMAAVSIWESTGTTTIHAQGDVGVENHTGTLTIKCHNGRVSVADLTGNLDASTSFKSLIVENITGEVVLGNQNGLINVRQVEGKVVAKSKFGDIVAEGLRGPMKLISQQGDVSLVVDRQISGESSINTVSGQIFLALSREFDIHLIASTAHGEIRSPFKTPVIEEGDRRLIDVALGAATQRLIITGKHADIMIHKMP